MRHFAAVLLLVSGLASAESINAYSHSNYPDNVMQCRNISFAIERDECLDKILATEAVKNTKSATLKNEKHCALLAEKQQRKDKAISASNYGTWSLLCQITLANPDKYLP